MKKLIYASLLITTYQALYVMDKEIVLDEKSIQKIVNCTTKCANDHWEDLRDVSHKKPIQVCNDICRTLFSCKEKAKQQQEQTRTLLAAIESFKKTNN